MISKGTEEDYLRLKKQLASTISSNIETSEKIEALRQISWDIRDKFEVYLGDETDLTERGFKLYEEAGKVIRSLQKKK